METEILMGTTPYYDESLEPIYHATSGEVIIFQTPDCWGNQLNETVLKSDLYQKGLEINPCGGPVYIEGAEPGDTLKVSIEGIKCIGSGHLAIIKEEFGILGQYLGREETVVVPINNGYAEFYGKIKVPIKPMLGVLSVCPSGEKLSTLLSGRYGGNMDCNLLREGSILYLPVQVPGGMLITGDVHALQGDGECLASLEVAAQITLKVDLIKGRQEDWPVLETDINWYVITSALTSDEANSLALKAMAEFMIKRSKLSNKELLSLMGTTGNVQTCKVVDTYKTARFEMTKEIACIYEF